MTLTPEQCAGFQNGNRARYVCGRVRRCDRGVSWPMVVMDMLPDMAEVLDA